MSKVKIEVSDGTHSNTLLKAFGIVILIVIGLAFGFACCLSLFLVADWMVN